MDRSRVRLATKGKPPRAIWFGKMTALNRKLLRDTMGMAAQAIAIGLVMACGVATFVMSLCTYLSLQETRDRYYDRYAFANVFVQLKRAPNSLAERVVEIPGVAEV